MIYLCIAILVYALFFFKNNYNPCYKPVNLIENKKKRNTKISVIAIIILIAFAALRATTVGYDTPNYYLNFTKIAEANEISNGHNFEFIFQLINWFAAGLFGKQGFFFVLLICETIILCCVAYCSKKLSNDVILVFFFFVTIDIYLRGFDQLRQSVAIALLMCATASLLNKDFCRYFAFVFLAFMFHKTSIIFAPIGLCCLQKTEKLRLSFYSFVMLCVVFFCIFETQIIKIISDIFHLYYYDRYIATGSWRQKLTVIGYCEIVVSMLIFVAFYCFKLWCNKKRVMLSKTYDILLDVYFFAVVFYIISGICQSPAIYGRLVYLFFWPIIFLAPQVVWAIKEERLRTFIYVCEVALALAYLLATLYIVDAHGIMPYVLA